MYVVPLPRSSRLSGERHKYSPISPCLLSGQAPDVLTDCPAGGRHCGRLGGTAWGERLVPDHGRPRHSTDEGQSLLRQYPVHCARDHWAVRLARAGTPIAVIQARLSHGSPMLTLIKYGRFLPRASDRGRWEEEATKYELARREAR
jgi:hypothetical protein